MIIRLGPLPREGAIHWTQDTIALLDVLGEDTVLPFALPREQLTEMRKVLEAMRRRALSSDAFEWEVETSLDDLKPILTYWLNIGRLSDKAVAEAGASWSSPEGEEFHSAMLDSLLDQVAEVDGTYAERLRRAWRQPVAQPELFGSRGWSDVAGFCEPPAN